MSPEIMEFIQSHSEMALPFGAGVLCTLLVLKYLLKYLVTAVATVTVSAVGYIAASAYVDSLPPIGDVARRIIDVF